MICPLWLKHASEITSLKEWEASDRVSGVRADAGQKRDWPIKRWTQKGAGTMLG